MPNLLLTIVCFAGFVYAANRLLKIHFGAAPIFVVSLIGIILFEFALAGHLKSGSIALMCLGFAFAGIGIVDGGTVYIKYKKTIFPISLFVSLIVLIIFSFAITLGMKFTVTDDYVYWGILGKYLYLNHHLPDSDTTIIARHLAYTPGTSLFHYFFYTLSGKYSESVSYFAQSILLVSALFVVLEQKTFKRTLIFLSVLIIVLTIFFGSVFTKLQVDYLLSVYFFSLLWIFFQKQYSANVKFLIIAPSLCFLFLIKEIGFLLGGIILCVILIDLLFHKRFERDEKIKGICVVFFIGGSLLFLKYQWTAHCQAMGLSNFSSGVNVETIKNALCIFSDEKIRNGFLIFVKDILIGPADRINLPYLLWYAIICFFWVGILRKLNQESRTRYFNLVKIVLLFFVLYLLMLYFMQIIVFNIGRGSGHTIGLARYMNILFSPIVLFTVLLYLDLKYFKKVVSNKMVVCFVSLVFLILCASRIETTLRRESHYMEAENIAAEISMALPVKKDHRLALISGSNDNNLGLMLLYHLLPVSVNYTQFPVGEKETFFKRLASYDFALFNHPGAKVKKWVEPLMDKGVEKRGLYRIDRTENSKMKLKKIVEIEQVLF